MHDIKRSCLSDENYLCLHIRVFFIPALRNNFSSRKTYIGCLGWKRPRSSLPLPSGPKPARIAGHYLNKMHGSPLPTGPSSIFVSIHPRLKVNVLIRRKQILSISTTLGHASCPYLLPRRRSKFSRRGQTTIRTSQHPLCKHCKHPLLQKLLGLILMYQELGFQPRLNAIR